MAYLPSQSKSCSGNDDSLQWTLVCRESCSKIVSYSSQCWVRCKIVALTVVCIGSYFTKQELRELFVLDDPTTSQTQIQLSRLHAGLRKSDTSLDAHIAFLHTLGMFTSFTLWYETRNYEYNVHSKTDECIVTKLELMSKRTKTEDRASDWSLS